MPTKKFKKYFFYYYSETLSRTLYNIIMKLNRSAKAWPRKGYYYKFVSKVENWYTDMSTLPDAGLLIYIICFSEKKAWWVKEDYQTCSSPNPEPTTKIYKPSALPTYKYSQWNPTYWDCIELTKEQAFEELL